MNDRVPQTGGKQTRSLSPGTWFVVIHSSAVAVIEQTQCKSNKELLFVYPWHPRSVLIAQDQ